MPSILPVALSVIVVATTPLLGVAFYYVCIVPRFNPLRKLAGPPVRWLFDNHMSFLLNPYRSPKAHSTFVQKYGRHVRIRGLGPWDDRLLPLDPVSVAHVLKNSTIYEKPWQSRRFITSLIGCGMLAAEGVVHKRHRRVATPAFSIQNLRSIVPVVFTKGNELREKWCEILDSSGNTGEGVRIDVCHWISRATFDVIGLAGFEYHFNAIQNESDELFHAYKEMFEIAVSQSDGLRTVIGIYIPLINEFFPDERVKTVKRCQEVIERVAGKLIQQKKSRIVEGEETGLGYAGKDLLTLLIKSNLATDLPPDQRISDEDILHNINTFMFAGSDTTSLALTWTLYLLAKHPGVQRRLQAELLEAAPSPPVSRLTSDEIESLYIVLSDLPYLNDVVRESLRLIPPVHSSLRVATRDDEIPISCPIRLRDESISDQKSIRIAKGSLVHVPIEAFNLDKEIWGKDAWDFNPDRWGTLPEAVSALPGIFSNLLTFSAGPRSCIGMRFSMIEMKTFLYLLLTNFVFSATDEEIFKANVVLTRPYITGQFKAGSQCPLLVKRYTRQND
ncbi:cytochrome P450 [Pisolithus orientalis]|uniref:cytochrome P450 n=1 Tax=Pisolithus orientalis TaxID=936130 RepID=UPI002224D70E|nr:cytochrome P450 [Pisolithus orientalis]KAI6033190.1 cytochrome P450 [Pisolithus orientalis]